jgi:hypothetical protein
MKRQASRAACVVALSVLAMGGPGCGSSSNTTATSSIKHIFVIMMENHGFSQIVGNTADAPYINQLASQYGVASQYFGVTHPSLPNYLSLFSGDFQGIWDDCPPGQTVTCAPEEFVPNSGDATSAASLTPSQIQSASTTPHWFTGQNLVDQLEAKNFTWKAYMEAMPEVGFTGSSAPAGGALYAVKHNPFFYFSDIAGNNTRLQQIVPFTGFAQDMAAGNLPNFIWVTPHQCHDMHGMGDSSAAALGYPSCGYPASGLDHGAIQLGDQFLAATVPQIMNSPSWNDGSVLVIVWDEDDYSGYSGCCGSPVGEGGVTLGGANAPALVITSAGPAHIESTTAYNHYSLLATIESVWGLGCLANSCSIDSSNQMTVLFEP